MRKLTVKNFSVIKEAELEFGKITVLIGPQSSGKSLLCKLAYFLGPGLTEIISEFAARQRTWDDLEEFASRQFQQRFPEIGWGIEPFIIYYEQERFGVKAIRKSTESGPFVSIVFSEGIRNFYAEKLSSPWGGPNDPEGESAALTTFFRSWNYLVALNDLQEHRKVETSAFIPANRAFFSNLNNVFELFRNENIDIILREFAANLDWAAKPKSERPEAAIKTEILTSMESIQGGRVRVIDGKPAFEAPNGMTIPMGMTSSGTQELVPLFMLLSKLVEDSFAESRSDGFDPIRERFLIVEEPEGHVFPSTQYELVRLFSWLQNDAFFQFSWVITTHSPYILTAFNTLIEAWRVGNKEGKREQVAAIIPEKYWVNENDFRAYTIDDGVLTSIFEKEAEGKEGSGLIDGDFLDSVSDNLGAEFDKLLDIEYAN
jgi:hypothetical protein